MALVECHQANGVDQTQFKVFKEFETFEMETGKNKGWQEITYEYS